jgi:hypothetical protein
VDPGYAQARLQLRFHVPIQDTAGAAGILDELERSIVGLARSHMPDAVLSIAGQPVKHQRTVWYVGRGQLVSAVIFLVFLFLFNAAILRSVRWGAIALMPTVTSVTVLFGLMGWLRVPLTALMPLAAAAVMGVSVDDVLCLLLTYRRAGARGLDPVLLVQALHTSRAAIFQTTLIMVAGLAVLSLSVSRLLRQSGLLAATAMAAATATTLLVVPSAMLLVARRGRPSLGEGTRP